jgi:carbonic anhydrase/acetyltransferase-like protein (isoleucine patch superfamily)
VSVEQGRGDGTLQSSAAPGGPDERLAPGGARLEPWDGVWPAVDPTAWCHRSAVIIGDVVVEAGASIWPTVVLRGDQGSLRVGAESSIQDGAVLHATRGLSHTVVGARVTVGHRAILHGCVVEDDVLIGMGAIVLDGAVVERHCVIGAGAVVGAGKRIPAGSMVMGVPARVVRQLRPDEIASWIAHGHEEYLRLTRLLLAEAAAAGPGRGPPGP